MIEYRFVDKEEFLPLIKKYRNELFKDNKDIDVNSLYTENEKEQTTHLSKMCSTQYRLYLTAWDKDQLIAWSWGYQISGLEFYMCNSAVFPEYRRRGIYSELLNIILQRTNEDGFQEVTSKHHADNNSVIIPKLKIGFVIKGFEINTRFGLLVNLVKYKSDKILNVHNQRTGLKG